MARFQRKADFHIRRRILVMAALFCVVCMGAVIARLAWLQLINTDFYQQKALASQTRDVTIYSTRGTIYDVNGKPLAISASTEMLILNPRKLAPDKFSELSAAEKAYIREKKGLGEDTKDSQIELTDGDKRQRLPGPPPGGGKGRGRPGPRLCKGKQALRSPLF